MSSRAAFTLGALTGATAALVAMQGVVAWENRYLREQKQDQVGLCNGPGCSCEDYTPASAEPAAGSAPAGSAGPAGGMA